MINNFLKIRPVSPDKEVQECYIICHTSVSLLYLIYTKKSPVSFIVAYLKAEVSNYLQLKLL